MGGDKVKPLITRLQLKRNQNEPCHSKSGLKVFVVVTSQEGLAGTSPASFWYGTDCKI